MMVEKKRNPKETTPDEPNTRFYVQKWDATDAEMDELRSFIKENKHRNNPKGGSITRRRAKKIVEK